MVFSYREVPLEQKQEEEEQQETGRKSIAKTILFCGLQKLY